MSDPRSAQPGAFYGAAVEKLFTRFPILQRVPGWIWGAVGLGIVGLVILGAKFASSAVTGTSGSYADQTIAAPINGAITTADVLFKLGLVLGLIYLSVWLVRRWRGGIMGAAPKQMTVLESTHLSPRQAIHLVRVGEHTLLIGATDSNVVLLSEVDAAKMPEKALAPVKSAARVQPNTEQSFASVFGQAISLSAVENSRNLQSGQ